MARIDVRVSFVPPASARVAQTPARSGSVTLNSGETFLLRSSNRRDQRGDCQPAYARELAQRLMTVQAPGSFGLDGMALDSRLAGAAVQDVPAVLGAVLLPGQAWLSARRALGAAAQQAARQRLRFVSSALLIDAAAQRTRLADLDELRAALAGLVDRLCRRGESLRTLREAQARLQETEGEIAHTRRQLDLSLDQLRLYTGNPRLAVLQVPRLVGREDKAGGAIEEPAPCEGLPPDTRALRELNPEARLFAAALALARARWHTLDTDRAAAEAVAQAPGGLRGVVFAGLVGPLLGQAPGAADGTLGELQAVLDDKERDLARHAASAMHELEVVVRSLRARAGQPGPSR